MNKKPETYVERAIYITCDVSNDGVWWPMGKAKTLEYATDIAQRHGQILCKLVKIKDFLPKKNV